VDVGSRHGRHVWVLSRKVSYESGLGRRTRTNIRYDLALHQLTHGRVQAVNVAMHGELEISLCFVPL
jgi:hypothetical protein